MGATVVLMLMKKEDDEEALIAFRQSRRRVAFGLVAAIVIGLIILYLTNGARGAPLT